MPSNFKFINRIECDRNNKVQKKNNNAWTSGVIYVQWNIVIPPPPNFLYVLQIQAGCEQAYLWITRASRDEQIDPAGRSLVKRCNFLISRIRRARFCARSYAVREANSRNEFCLRGLGCNENNSRRTSNKYDSVFLLLLQEAVSTEQREEIQSQKLPDYPSKLRNVVGVRSSS